MRGRSSRAAPPSGLRFRAFQFAVVAATPLVIAAVYTLIGLYFDEGLVLRMTFMAGTLILGFAAFGLLSIERARTVSNDRWRHARRRERLRAAGRHAEADALESPVRSADARRGRLPDLSEYTLIEWSFLVYLVTGFPILVRLLGLPAALVAFPTGGMVYFAVMNFEEGLRGGRYGRLGARKRREEVLARAGHANRWWSSSPPPVLRVARGLFLAYSVFGFLACMLVVLDMVPWKVDDHRVAPAIWVGGFLVLLVVLGRAERIQRRTEAKWRDGRRAPR